MCFWAVVFQVIHLGWSKLLPPLLSIKNWNDATGWPSRSSIYWQRSWPSVSHAIVLPRSNSRQFQIEPFSLLIMILYCCSKRGVVVPQSKFPLVVSIMFYRYDILMGFSYLPWNSQSSSRYHCTATAMTARVSRIAMPVCRRTMLWKKFSPSANGPKNKIMG